MVKMYLVVSHAVKDYSDCGVGTKLFGDIEKAKKEFQRCVEKEKREIKRMNNEWIILANTDVEFEACEENYYAQNHTHIEIRVLSIN